MANGLNQVRRLVSQEDAALVQRPSIPRSKFIGSFSHKTTFDAGYLIPFLCDEILPGDHMRYSVTGFIRMGTALFPMMDSQRVDTFFFFVPNRLTWKNWPKMMGEQDSPGDSIDYTVPVVVSPPGGFAEHSVYDHFGLPTDLDAGATIEVSALPTRAYRLIYHEWFRDQNLINHTKPTASDLPDPHGDTILYKRAKSADYFTSALPWPQRFQPPSMSLGTTAPIRGIAFGQNYNPTPATPSNYQETGGATVAGWQGFHTAGAGGGNAVAFQAISNFNGADPLIYADLANSTGVSVNQLREMFLVQQLLEIDARGGTRYTEQVQAQFGVRSQDSRLQRPEYIGGGSSPLNITPIAQTAPTAGQPVGTLGAAGTSVGQHTASFAATEHGYVIGIVNVKSELSYQQGLRRHWSRRTRFEFYTPPLAGLGEQAIYRKELYARGVAQDDEVFGYQERWHEYRTVYSEVTGQFRSTTAGTLDAWHLAQRFTSAPVLGQTFIEDTPPMDRVLAAAALAVNQQYIGDFLIRREATRPIPMYGTPATLGRF